MSKEEEITRDLSNDSIQFDNEFTSNVISTNTGRSTKIQYLYKLKKLFMQLPMKSLLESFLNFLFRFRLHVLCESRYRTLDLHNFYYDYVCCWMRWSRRKYCNRHWIR